MDFDTCETNLKLLIASSDAAARDRNEAATRLQIIDDVLFKCLGWMKSDCDPEDHQLGEFADYVLKIEVRAMVVEAKREGISFSLPAGFSKRRAKLSFFKDHHRAVYDAIKQAADYAQKRGVSVAIATNGHQYIGFIATREDGVAPLDGDAVIFSSLEEIRDDFLSFWNYFSKVGVSKRLLRAELLRSATPSLPIKLSRHIPGYPLTQRRNSLQTDLQIVSEIVFEDLAKAKDLNELFLKECYCESGALSQYALVSKTILETRYDALFQTEATDPTLVAATTNEGISSELVAESLSKRPILLIGDVGVGKSSFINYLTTVYIPSLKTKSIFLYIDLGSSATLSTDIRLTILDSIEIQLLESYSIDVQSADLVKNVYWPETKRFATSITGSLYKNDSDKYNEKLTEHLASLASRREDHLAKVLQFLSKSQKRQVIIFIDNADQRSENTQQKAFLVAQELSQSWHATVFVALRPTTFHSSVKAGALSGYHPKAFSIAPPRIDKVIQRRLDFGIKLAAGDIKIEGISNAIKVNLHTLCDLMKVLKFSLIVNDALIEALENLSSGNVRRALDLVRDFFGSGHINTEKIISIYRETGRYTVATHEFMRSLIFGHSSHFDPSRSEFSNIFDIRFSDPKDHFSIPIILGILLTYKNSSSNQGWVPLPEVIGTMQTYGFTDEQVLQATVAGNKARLFEFLGADSIEWGYINSITLRINSRGAYHHQRVPSKFYYMDAVVIDTPILAGEFRRDIADVHSITDRINRAIIFSKYLSNCWQSVSQAQALFDWPTYENALYAEIETISRRANVTS